MFYSWLFLNKTFLLLCVLLSEFFFLIAVAYTVDVFLNSSSDIILLVTRESDY